MNELNNNTSGWVTLANFIPILRFVLKKQIDQLIFRMNELIDIMMEKYHLHQKDYQFGQIRDFTDAMISAKNDALQNEKESATYLTDRNLFFSLIDLFTGKIIRIIFIYLIDYLIFSWN